jgi:hypothetical protein
MMSGDAASRSAANGRGSSRRQSRRPRALSDRWLSGGAAACSATNTDSISARMRSGRGGARRRGGCVGADEGG